MDTPFSQIEIALGFPVKYDGDRDPPGYYLDAPHPEFLGVSVAAAIREGKLRASVATESPPSIVDAILDVVEQHGPALSQLVGAWRRGQRGAPSEDSRPIGSTNVPADESLPE